MDTRGLGPEGLVSSTIALGTAAFTGVYGAVSTRDCIRVIDVALDSGISLLDTADFYADGDIERLLGASVGARRPRLLMSTHGGLRIGRDGSPSIVDGRPDYLVQACEASLRRLGTDYIDLYYLSRVDPRVPVEESVGRLAELVAAGKIRHLGLYQASPDDLRRATAVHPISVQAVDYSLRDRAVEKGILVTAAELGVGVVAYRPLAQGLLAGATPRSCSAKVRRALHILEAEAAGLDIGMARLALAWLARCRNVVPAPSSHNPAHLEMDASAAGIRLPADVCARLDGVFAP